MKLSLPGFCFRIFQRLQFRQVNLMLNLLILSRVFQFHLIMSRILLISLEIPLNLIEAFVSLTAISFATLSMSFFFLFNFSSTSVNFFFNLSDPEVSSGFNKLASTYSPYPYSLSNMLKRGLRRRNMEIILKNRLRFFEKPRDIFYRTFLYDKKLQKSSQRIKNFI